MAALENADYATISNGFGENEGYLTYSGAQLMETRRLWFYV